jgi:phage terminase large subunit GpA-like protein
MAFFLFPFIADPGAWHLHSEVTEEYAAQMCAEYVDEKTGFWTCPEPKPNHYWDCAVYNLAAADILGIKFWKEAGAVQTKQMKESVQQRQLNMPSRIRTRPSWFYNR